MLFCLFHQDTTCLNFISSDAAWWTSSIKIDRFSMSANFCLSSFSTISSSANNPVALLFNITFSAFTTKIWPNGFGNILFTFEAFGLTAKLDFLAVFGTSSISNFKSFFIFWACISGNTQLPSKDAIDLSDGAIEFLSPDGINIKKLCAKFLLFGSFNAKYKSRYINDAIR